MHAIGLVIGRIFAWMLGSLIFKLLAAFGVGFAVVTGVEALINGIFSEIQASTAGLDPNVVAILGMLRIDDAISVLAAAVAVRLSLRTFGVSGGGIKQLVFGRSQEGV